jgi:HlyD family secretion protein
MLWRDKPTPSRGAAPWTYGVAALVALAFLGCRSDATAKPEGDRSGQAKGEAKAVTLVPVAELAIEQTIDISGTLDPDEQVTVAAKVPGRLASITVDLSSPVTKGQAIAQLETTDYKLKIEQAAASLGQIRAQLGLERDGPDTVDADRTAIVKQALASHEEAKANLGRVEALAKEGLSSGSELDSAKAAAIRAESAVQSAREEVRIRQATMRQRSSELGIARQALEDTIVRSPLDGIVQSRRGNVGEFLTAGAPLVVIVRIDPLRLRVALPEREAADVRQGQPVRVTIPGEAAPHQGTVARLAPALDQQSRTLLVEADIKNPGHLRPGTLVTAQIVVTSKAAPTVPATSVVQFAGLSKVITVEEGKAREKTVTLGKTTGDRVEILTGVKVGDMVVDKPGSLQQGQPVRVEGS